MQPDPAGRDDSILWSLHEVWRLAAVRFSPAAVRPALSGVPVDPVSLFFAEIWWRQASPLLEVPHYRPCSEGRHAVSQECLEGVE